MSFFDDLATRAKQSYDQGIKTVEGYISNVKVDDVVKLLPPSKGNQTAAQIEAGQYGGPAPMAPANAAPASIAAAAQASSIAGASSFDIQKFIPFIAIGAIAFLFLGKRGRRG